MYCLTLTWTGIPNGTGTPVCLFFSHYCFFIYIFWSYLYLILNIFLIIIITFWYSKMFHVSGFIDGLLFVRMKGFLSTGLLSWFAANLFSTDDRLMGSCRLISKQGSKPVWTVSVLIKQRKQFSLNRSEKLKFARRIFSSINQCTSTPSAVRSFKQEIALIRGYTRRPFLR